MPIRIELPEIPEELKKEYEMISEERHINLDRRIFLTYVKKMINYEQLEKISSNCDDAYIEYIKELCKSSRKKDIFLDIDYLKSLENKPYWFGLGFIQLKIDANTRLHFWHPELAPNVDDEEIHDHRYDFKSTILKGELTNTLFDVQNVENGEYELCWVNCKPEHSSTPEYISDVSIKPVSSIAYKAGQYYNMGMDDFHRSKFTVPTVTYLERGAVLKEKARIVKNKLKPSVCPFSVKKSEEEIWKIIQEILS